MPNQLVEQEIQALRPMPDDNMLTSELLKRYERVLTTISEMADVEYIRPLIELFGYGEGFGVYWSAVHCLEKFSEHDVDPILLQTISSVWPGVRMWSALMLGRSRNKASVPELIKLLSDDKDLVRRNAVIALEMIEGRNALEIIKSLENDSSTEVRGEVSRIRNKYGA